MADHTITVVEKLRFPKRQSNSVAYCEITENKIRIFVKKNQTRRMKIQFIIHELFEWGDRILIRQGLPDTNERKSIHEHAEKMDAIAIKLISPYL